MTRLNAKPQARNHGAEGPEEVSSFSPLVTHLISAIHIQDHNRRISIDDQYHHSLQLFRLAGSAHLQPLHQDIRFIGQSAAPLPTSQLSRNLPSTHEHTGALSSPSQTSWPPVLITFVLDLMCTASQTRSPPTYPSDTRSSPPRRRRT